MNKACNVAARAGSVHVGRLSATHRMVPALLLGLVLSANSTVAVHAQSATDVTPNTLRATLPSGDTCPVTGMLRLTDARMLERFRALANCHAQAVPGDTPTPAPLAAPVALEGKSEGEAAPAEGEKGGVVGVQGSPAGNPATAALVAPVSFGSEVAVAAGLPEMIVRLQPALAELDLAVQETEAVALQDTSILAFAPRSYTTQHDRLIAATARRHRIDPLLLHAIVRQESNYGASARSSAGAVGLMQIMPATGARFGHPAARLSHPADNLDAGARLLRALHARYGNNFDLILAAYNAGEGAVARYGNRIPPFRETRDYVRLVKGHYAALAAQNGQSLARRF